VFELVNRLTRTQPWVVGESSRPVTRSGQPATARSTDILLARSLTFSWRSTVVPALHGLGPAGALDRPPRPSAVTRRPASLRSERRGFRRRPERRASMKHDRLPWPSPSEYRLGALLAACAVFLNDAAGFASCCGPVGCPPRTGGGLPPPRPRDLARRRECCYRGPWRLPGPDSHRPIAAR
jgi:hypothetical protein